MCCRPLLPLLALAALLALPPASEALSCFKCMEPVQGQGLRMPKGAFVGDTDQICSKFDSSSSTFMVDCPAGFDKSCYKTITVDGAVASRGCYNKLQNNCTAEQSGETTCYCTSDYCNSAGLTAPALLLMVPAALMAALYSRQ